jgi:hypothetical protein
VAGRADKAYTQVVGGITSMADIRDVMDVMR